jgi:hypothetical protein
MTNTLRSFPRPVRTPPTNWRQWADGDVHELKPGKHFTQGLKQARNAFITWAGRHGMSCHTAIFNGSLFVQAWDR